MKIKYFILTIIVLVTGSIVTGYNKSNTKANTSLNWNAKQAIREAKNVQNDNIDDLQKYKIEAKAKIDANDVRIGKFKSEVTSTNKKANDGYTKEVARLEEQNNVLKNKLSDYKYEGKEKLEVFKQGFNHDMEVVGRSISDLLTKRH